MKRLLPFLFLLTVFTSDIDSDELLPQHFELNQLLVVNALGIDSDENGNFKLTLAYTQANETNDISLLYATGKSFSAAVANAASYAGRSVFLGHSRLIIIGKAAGERGLTEIVDYVTRSYETSLNVQVITSAGEASTLLSASSLGSSDILSDLDTLLANLEINSLASPVTLAEVIAAVDDEYRYPITPLVETVENENGSFNVMTGSAIYRGDRLYTFLTGDDAVMLTALRNRANSHVITVNTDFAGLISLRVTSFKTKATFSEQDGKLSLSLSGDIRATMVESSSGHLTGGDIERLIAVTEADIKKKAEAFFLRYGNEDFCQFADTLRRFHPFLFEKWQGVENTAMDIRVNCILENSFIHGGG